MKKSVIIFLLIVLACTLFLYVNPHIISASSIFSSIGKPKNTAESIIKYEDCIREDDFKTVEKLLERNRPLINNEHISTVEVYLERYMNSMDSTLQNLNTIDSHSFLHQEYNRCKNSILVDGSAPLKSYYNLRVMAYCLDRDRKLNLSSQSSSLKP